MLAWPMWPMGRVVVRVSLLIPVFAAALAVLGGDLWLRYLLLLAALFLHELAHGVASVGLGGPRAVISIWPWFGRADVASGAGRRQVIVALAGPAANLGAAAILLALGGRFTLALGRAGWLDFLAGINLLMGAGNLLPVRPTDGWRALRAVSWRA